MVFIIHGYDSSPQKNWFRWLQSRLGQAEIPTQILSMPAPQTPILADWIAHLHHCAPKLGSNDIFVAHSLGCIATLQFLQVASFQKLGGIVLVSGFFEPIAGLEMLDSFTAQKLDFKHLNKKIAHRAVIAARDDTIVPFEETEKLAISLESDFILYKTGNHFMDSDGFTEFPIVEFLVLQALAQKGEARQNTP